MVGLDLGAIPVRPQSAQACWTANSVRIPACEAPGRAARIFSSYAQAPSPIFLSPSLSFSFLAWISVAALDWIFVSRACFVRPACVVSTGSRAHIFVRDFSCTSVSALLFSVSTVEIRSAPAKLACPCRSACPEIRFSICLSERARDKSCLCFNFLFQEFLSWYWAAGSKTLSFLTFWCVIIVTFDLARKMFGEISVRWWNFCLSDFDCHDLAYNFAYI
jgi:hypothetical protein